MPRTKEKQGNIKNGWSFYFYDNPSDCALMEKSEELRRRDGISRSNFVKLALAEYVQRHMPGNPALPLDHWMTDLPLSIAATEKLYSDKLRRDHLPAKIHVFACQYCNGKGCEWCGGRGEYYQVLAGMTVIG
jgi:hypothetical protein